MAPAGPTCVLCGRTLEEGAPGRTEGARFKCRACLTLETLLYRNLGRGSWQGFTMAERQGFFAKCRADQDDLGKGHSWQTVRSVLVTRLSHQHLREQSQEVQTESLPLSVWLSRGWPEELVKSCPTHKEPMFGDTELYTVPTRMERIREVQTQAEEKVCEMERAVRKRKADKAGLGGEPEVDLEVAAGPGLPAASAGGKGGGKASGAGGTSAETRLKQEKKRTDKQNQQVADLAGKALGQVTPVLKTLPGLIAQAEKWSLSEDHRAALQTAREEALQWRTRATEALSFHEQVKATGVPLKDLGFTKEDLKERATAWKDLQKEVRAEIKGLKEQKAAEQLCADMAAGGDRAAKAEAKAKATATSKGEPKRRRKQKGQ